MRNRVVSAILSSVVLLCAAVRPVAAQQPTTSQEFDLSASAIYDVVLNEYTEASNLGAHFDVAKRFLRGDDLAVSALGEFGFNHFENFTLSSYAGGIRFASTSSAKLSPFVQILMGAEHCCGSTEFAIQPGGGLDFPWKQQFAVRVQADWRHVNGTLDDADGLRIGIGIVFPLSR